MKREVIRVEPLSTWLERWKAPTSAVTRHGDTIYVSGFPPFDPETGEVVDAPIERQTELVLEQLKLCVETAGSSLENVLKCNVYCTSVEKFAAVNAIYARYFPKDPPARIFINVPAWPGISTSRSTASPRCRSQGSDPCSQYFRSPSEARAMGCLSGLAKMLRPELEQIDGFVDNIRYRSLTREGWMLSLSGWRDEKALVRWRTQARHHVVQEKGRSEIFLDYHLRIGQMTQDTGCPRASPAASSGWTRPKPATPPPSP